MDYRPSPKKIGQVSQGRHSHSPVPVCSRNPRNRSVATIQRTWRHPGQRSPRGSGSPAYINALSVLDGDMSQYIHDNTEDEFSHFTFINAYLVSKGADPVNLDKFRTLPSSKATGAQQIGRLTNLMQLTVDTSYWTRYRSRTGNPDFGDTFPPAIPGLLKGQFPAIPRNDNDLKGLVPGTPQPSQTPPGDRQHGRLPFCVYRARWHQPLPIAGSAGHQSGSVAHLAQYRPNRDSALSDLA